METTNNQDPQIILRQWRIKVLNVFLIIVAAVSALGTAVSISDAISHPEQWPIAILFIMLELILIALAVFRKIDYRVRAWAVLLVPYLVGVSNLASFGLGSSGRLFLLAVPIGGLILSGVRSGVAMSVFVAITIVVFSILAKLDLLQQWLVTDRNSLLLSDWFAESIDTLILLITIMALLIMFYRFQERTIARERHAQAELRRTQGLLEKQNVILEQKVDERTQELQASNLSLEQRNNELVILNSVGEAMAKTLDVLTVSNIVGDKVREIFHADGVSIELLDVQSNLIHETYCFDIDHGGQIEPTAPFPLGTGMTSQVIQTSQPILAGTLEDQTRQGAYTPPEIIERIEKGLDKLAETVMVVPVVIGEQVLGAVIVGQYKKNAFDDNDLRLLQTLSSNMAVAIQNARLFEAEQQRNAELAIINSVQQGLASKLDIQAIYDLVGNKVCEIFSLQTCYIMLYDKQTNIEYYPFIVEDGVRLKQEPILGDERGFGPFVLRTRQPLLINEKMAERSQEIDSYTIGGDQEPKSAIYVPLLIGDESKGVISVQNMQEEHAFSASDLRLLTTLASSMSVALESARLFSEAQRLIKEMEQRNAELAVINSIQQGLAAKLDFQLGVDLVGDKLQEVFNTPDLSIGWYEESTNLIHYLYAYEHGQRITVPSFPPLPGGMFETMQKTRQPMVFNTQAEFNIINSEVVPGTDQSKSLVAVPIVRGERVLGVLQLENYERENAYGEAELRLLTTIAGVLGASLENVQLFDETQRLLKETEQRAAELAMVNTLSSALISELDIDALINLVGEQLRSIFRPDIVYIALMDRESHIINFPYQYGDVHTPLPLGQGLTSKVIQSGEPLLINRDIEQRRKELGTAQVGKSVRSFLGVPVFVSGEAVGVISVQHATREEAYNEKDQHLLSTIAANVGTALQNARLFEEIKRQEQQAYEMQRRLADIISFLPNATLVIDRDGKVIAWNQAIEEMTGILATDMLGKNNHEYALPFFGKRQPILIDLVLMPQEKFEQEKYGHIERTGEILTSETVTPTLKGGARFLYATASALRDSAGNIVGAIEIIRDITDQKEAEEALRKSEHLYRSVIDNSVDVFYRADRDGNIVLASPSGAKLLGYDSVQDLIGLNLLRDVYFNPEDRKPLLEEIQKHGFVKNFETKIKRRDGTPITVLVNSRTYVDEHGKTLGIEGFLRDFSDRKQMEDDLRKAKAEAEQANHAKSAFLANMSHELRTPLNAIIGFTRIVRRKSEGVLPEKQTENLDKVLTSADNLLNLINTVLDIAKIEAGRMDVLPANFRIHPLIDLCANTAQPLLRPTVTFEKQVSENLTYVYSDQDKIRQIILNLLSNAAKFTHTGQITLAAMQVGENLRITVTDTGIGIRAEALPNIFKEFEQADATTNRNYGGTGLGLTISHNLARLLGGDLTVESEFGHGSIFTLIIPMQYERDYSQLESATLPAANLQSDPEVESVHHPEAESPQKHILVIDDDPDAVYLLQENLDQQEFKIIGCSHAQDGLQMAKECHPQAILLDILMPGADGWQVLHDLKTNPVTADIPVILHTIVDKKTLGFQLGASAYLLKPLDPVAVRETLDRVIGHRMRHPKQVLVVDDDPNVADMLRQFLPQSDFSLESALDGLAGLNAVEKHRPDILLLDLLMPKLDGFGVIKRLQANPKTHDLPIIVISAKDLTTEEISRLQETVAVVLKKQGFEGEKLVKEINRVLRRN